MTQFEFDPIAFLKQLNQQVATWEQQAEAMAKATDESAGEAENQHVRIRVSGGRVLSLEFTEAAPGASRVQVRQSILDAYQEAAAHSNQHMSSAMSQLGWSQLAEGIGASAPPQVREQPVDPEHEADVSAEKGTEPVSVPWQSVEDVWADPSLDDEDLKDFAEELREIGLDDPTGLNLGESDWQHDLDQEMDALAASAEGLRERLEQVAATAECKTMAVTVNGFGLLVEATLRPPAQNRSAEQLTRDFAETYDEACRAAGEEVTEAMPEGDWPDISGITRPHPTENP